MYNLTLSEEDREEMAWAEKYKLKIKMYNLTLSQSFCSSIIAVGDSISGRMLNAWPSFMYAGPKEVTISLSSMARATSF